MRKLFFAFFLLTTSLAIAQSQDELSIRKILEDQTAAWNRGDIDGFMKGYWENDSLMFIGKSGVTYGWSNTLKNYKKKYPELKNTMFAPGQTEILVNYRVTKTTTKYAIDKNGKIIYIGAGAFDEEQWKTLLEALTR